MALPLDSSGSSSATASCDTPSLADSSPELPGELIYELWLAAEGKVCGIEPQEFGALLARVGNKCSFGMPPGEQAGMAEQEAFCRALRLQDLALAHGCARGNELAWERFMALYRAPITQASIAITGSSTLGQDLAESLYSELFGLKERAGNRVSPLDSYTGRGSLLGWLRATLLQRNVDRHRRTQRETELGEVDVPAPPSSPVVPPQDAHTLVRALSITLRAAPPEDRFLLTAYYLDRCPLLQIGRLLGVHEATVSRRLKKVLAEIREELLKNLQAAGFSARRAKEALDTDPRDLEINLRSALQSAQSGAFKDQEKQARGNTG